MVARPGLGLMSRLRVINLGLPKSGTTTLARALGRGGLAVADWRVRAGQSRGDGLAGEFVARLMYLGYYETGDPLALMDEFDAFAEISVIREGFNLWPQTDWGLIAAIRAHHPGARFVLSTRPAAHISDSMARWSNLGTERLPRAAIPGLPVGRGGQPHERIRWIEGHHAFCRQVFTGASDFLEYDTESETARARLSAFLGRDLPWWGRANANRKRPAQRVSEGES